MREEDAGIRDALNYEGASKAVRALAPEQRTNLADMLKAEEEWKKMGVTDEETTSKLRAHINALGKKYTAGYVVDGRIVCEEDSTNLETTNGNTVSFEEAIDGTYTLFDLTFAQACKIAETL